MEIELGGLGGTNRALEPKRLMQRVADETLDLIAGAEGVMIGLRDPPGAVTYVCGSGYLEPFVGTTVELGASLSGLAVATGEVLRADDTELDPRVDRTSCRRLHVRSSVCVPLQRGGETIGVMAVSSSEPGAFDDGDVDALTQVAEFVGIVVGLALDLTTATTADAHSERFVLNVLQPDMAAWREARQRIQRILDDPDALWMVFQPIVDLVSGRVFAVEALARFDGPSSRAPDDWFREANEVGLGLELEMLALARALAFRESLPDDVLLTVNVAPATVVAPELRRALGAVDGGRVVIELTEHSRVDDYAQLTSALIDLRERGVRVAVDDTGAGFSSLLHILTLAPDFIKLDRALTGGIDLDPVRRALAASLLAFAAESGAEIIAEGVETTDELETCRALGIGAGQGFCLGEPGPLSLLPKVVTAP